MKIDYDPDEPESGFTMWDADLLTLLRVGRKFQDWIDGLGRFGGHVTVTLCTYFSNGDNCVHIEANNLVTERGHKAIKNKLYEIAVGAEWNLITEEIKAEIYRMS